MYRLEELGWSEFFEAQLTQEEKESSLPARVAEESRGAHLVYSEAGEIPAEISGRLRFSAKSRAELPAVGDWVIVDWRRTAKRAVIHRVLTRKGRFSRKVAGKTTEEQIVAANVDTVCLVSALNCEFNLRRMERYMSMAWESGARPVMVLNKSDLCTDIGAARREAEGTSPGVKVVVTSAATGKGVEELRELVRAGGTTAMLGSSGVGKSALTNVLLGVERQKTGEAREVDDRGRHTTTSRHLMVVPGGGILIDTPGMRELQLWNSGLGIVRAFQDIEELANDCKFRDCRHDGEPGCGVQRAIEDGQLDEDRLANLRKLQREQQFLEGKQNAALRAERTKSLRRMMREYNRTRRDNRD